MADPQNSNGVADNQSADPTKEAPQTGAEGERDEFGDFKDPEKALAEIKKLRAENAKHRTSNKDLKSQYEQMNAKLSELKKLFGGEDEQVDPAEQAKSLQEQNELLQVELAIGGLAREHGVSKEEDEYFRFLLSKKFDSLEEDEEMSDEDIEEIVKKVRKQTGSAPSSTGLNTKSNPNPQPNGGGLTVEAFVGMTTVEKSQLYAKSPEIYARLFNEASSKKLLK